VQVFILIYAGLRAGLRGPWASPCGLQAYTDQAARACGFTTLTRPAFFLHIQRWC